MQVGLGELFDDRFKTANLTFDGVAAKGGWDPTPPGRTRPYHRHEKGLLRKDGKPGFNTSTGKIELYSKLQEEWDLDPLPYYEEPEEGPISTPELWKEYPLILNSGRRVQSSFHSEHRQIPWLRELQPDPTVEIHPDTAKELDIVDGEWVYIENSRGRVKFKTVVTPTILPRVIAPTHSWWLPETDGKAPNFFGVWDHNINNLVPACTQGRSGWGGAGNRRFLCRIVKIKD
jgi:anaerobic selenocysteine-containing dehydrogenase